MIISQNLVGQRCPGVYRRRIAVVENVVCSRSDPIPDTIAAMPCILRAIDWASELTMRIHHFVLATALSALTFIAAKPAHVNVRHVLLSDLGKEQAFLA